MWEDKHVMWTWRDTFCGNVGIVRSLWRIPMWRYLPTFYPGDGAVSFFWLLNPWRWLKKQTRYIFALDRNISNLFQCLSSWYITYLMCLSSRELQFFYMWLYCWLWYHQAALYQWPVTDVIAGGGCRKRRVCFPRALTSGVTPVWPAVSLDQIQNREVNPPFCLLHKAPTAPPALSSDCLAVCV